MPHRELTVTPPVIPVVQNIAETTLPTTSHLPSHATETKYYKNGDKYVGEINEKEEPHGRGIMCWKNGRRYKGQWKNGRKNGQGVEYGANGAVNYSGEWTDDVFLSSHDDNDDDGRQPLNKTFDT